MHFSGNSFSIQHLADLFTVCLRSSLADAAYMIVYKRGHQPSAMNFTPSNSCISPTFLRAYAQISRDLRTGKDHRSARETMHVSF